MKKTYGVGLLIILLVGFALFFVFTSLFSQQNSGTATSTVLTTLPTGATSTPGTVSKPAQQEFATKSVMTTEFWVGEGATSDNDYIANSQSYWDEHWQEHYGGVDNPDSRCGYAPCTFTPKENPFYFALPYGEFDMQTGELKHTALQIPWYKAPADSTQSILKNRWIAVTHKGKTCYAQWEDVGPYLEDDFSYVFGTSSPHNTFDVRAGLDLSPATWDCLGMEDNDITSWKFVNDSQVPDGPWRKTVTTSGITWR